MTVSLVKSEVPSGLPFALLLHCAQLARLALHERAILQKLVTHDAAHVDLIRLCYSLALAASLP